MAVTAKLYGQVFVSAFNKEIDWDTDSVKAMLCTATYVPDQDVHRYKSSVTGECTGTGYTAGGIVVPTRTAPAYDGATNVTKLNCGTLAFGTLTVTGIRYVVFYVATAGDATSALISFMDLEVAQSPSAAPFNVTMANGVAAFTAA